jgi:hypothetical protein
VDICGSKNFNVTSLLKCYIANSAGNEVGPKYLTESKVKISLLQTMEADRVARG